DQGIHMAYRPKRSGIVEVRSLNFPTRAQWHINAVPDKPEHDWADYLRGAPSLPSEGRCPEGAEG
ncbi:MAG: hypothetical protein IJ960_10095, partial [Oscillospiraceae bacterium]|nr:hypothetical protein [Oscillospiraceae bacterium]